MQAYKNAKIYLLVVAGLFVIMYNTLAIDELKLASISPSRQDVTPSNRYPSPPAQITPAQSPSPAPILELLNRINNGTQPILHDLKDQLGPYYDPVVTYVVNVLLRDLKITDILLAIFAYMQVQIYRSQVKIMEQQTKIIALQYELSTQTSVLQNRPKLEITKVLSLRMTVNRPLSIEIYIRNLGGFPAEILSLRVAIGITGGSANFIPNTYYLRKALRQGINVISNFAKVLGSWASRREIKERREVDWFYFRKAALNTVITIGISLYNCCSAIGIRRISYGELVTMRYKSYGVINEEILSNIIKDEALLVVQMFLQYKSSDKTLVFSDKFDFCYDYRSRSFVSYVAREGV
jgi:hypothetical protein